MVEPKVKTIGVAYQVKVNNTLADSFLTLKEARIYIKSLPINADTNEVMIVKQTITEQVLDVYETKTITILSAKDLSYEI